MMHLFNTNKGPVVQNGEGFFSVSSHGWDELLCNDNLQNLLGKATIQKNKIEDGTSLKDGLLPPIENQEVWAAGVTYFRSRTARMEESKDAGGSDFYDRVYHADRPELFFKATRHRVSASGEPLHLRRDSKWIVPEPELALVVTPTGKIIGYTIGNDLSCRDIEGENPLYLPQAKTFNGCCGLGPGILVSQEPLEDQTEITIDIRRNGESVFGGTTEIGQMKKKPNDLVRYLFQDNSFPTGCILLTGTGVIPPDDFTLIEDDEIHITIEPIGTLINSVR